MIHYFRRITLKTDERINEIIRPLDEDQQTDLDIMYKYAREYKLSVRNLSNPWPNPPLIMVHGGAGSRKSVLIERVSQV